MSGESCSKQSGTRRRRRKRRKRLNGMPCRKPRPGLNRFRGSTGSGRAGGRDDDGSSTSAGQARTPRRQPGPTQLRQRRSIRIHQSDCGRSRDYPHRSRSSNQGLGNHPQLGAHVARRHLSLVQYDSQKQQRRAGEAGEYLSDRSDFRCAQEGSGNHRAPAARTGSSSPKKNRRLPPSQTRPPAAPLLPPKPRRSLQLLRLKLRRSLQPLHLKLRRSLPRSLLPHRARARPGHKQRLPPANPRLRLLRASRAGLRDWPLM